MARWILILFSTIIFTNIGRATTSCGLRSDQFPAKPLDEFQNRSCEDIKTSVACKKVYNQIQTEGGNPTDYELNCKDRSSLLRKLENIGEYQVGCALGGWNFAKDSFLGVAASVGEGVAKALIDTQKENEEEAKCDKDPSLKKALYTDYNSNVPKMLQIEVPKDEVFNRLNCSQLKVSRQLAQKRQNLLAMDKVRSRMTDPNAKFNLEEKEYVDWINKIRKGGGGNAVEAAKTQLQEMGIKIECYNDLRATAMVCETLLTGASVAAGGAGLALKVARIAGTESTAAKVLGHKLSSTQEKAVQKAHEIGGDRTYRINGGAPGEYTMTDLRQKAKTMKKARINQADRRTLMENGVVGNSPATTVGRTDQQFINQFNDGMSRRNTESVKQAASEGQKYFRAKATLPEAEFKRAFPEGELGDIVAANYFGLGTEESATLVNRFIQVYNYNPEQAKLTVISRLKRENKYYESSGSKVDLNDSSYRIYRNKELELKLTEEYYTSRAHNKYNELDFDQLTPGQQQNLMKLREEVQKQRKQAEKNKWPGATEYQRNY